MSESDFSINKAEGVAIVGLGVIGGSIAATLTEKGFENIWGIDRDEETVNQALERGFLSQGDTRPDKLLPRADVVIVCLYPGDTVEFIKNNMEFFKSGAVITDVSGIKEGLMDEIEGLLRDDVEFVGGHPMAGSQSKGIGYAHSDMFEGANYVITPCKTSTKQAIIKIENLARKIGCKTVTRLSSKEHDEAVTVASHMPHIAALALMDMCDLNKMESMIGPSFKDATRVAQINSSLWTELFINNRDNLDRQIQKMQQRMEALRTAIIGSDIEELEKIMDRAGNKRGRIG